MSLIVHTIPLAMSLAYIIESDSSLVLVDAGLRGEEQKIQLKMQSLGRDDLALIFITHAHIDHYGSAAALRNQTGAPIAIHRDDAEDMKRGQTRLGESRKWGRLFGSMLPALEAFKRPEPTEPDILLDDGTHLEGLGLEATVLHTPGHTAGSATLIVDGKLAFVGDLLSTTGRPHLQCYFAQEWPAIHSSLHRLNDCNPELIYPGHGPRPATYEEILEILHSL